MFHIRRRGKESLNLANAIKLSKMSNTMTGLDLMDKSLVDIVKSLIYYACACKVRYGVRDLKTSVKDILDDTLPSR